MAEAPRRRAVASWSADERAWYLDLVAQADGRFDTADEPSTALEQYEALPLDRCILLAGDGDTQLLDVNGDRWSDDRHGRWFQTRSKPLEWLHQRIGRLGLEEQRAVGRSEVASHICGWCHCIRAEHILYQPVREDRRDKAYHRVVGRGKIRPERMPKHLAISSPM